ncbi:IS30 family transposase [Amycolatopsis albispora]|uniref:IS30 family transposase n=1 Tax=Amycolatopsis albispora TaxID=1804986 RepID=UPI00196360F3|nr:IS30 family transposase [Amycolatopsis albispora]
MGVVMVLGRDVRVRFWGLVRAGWAVRPAAGLAGVSHETGRRWFAQAGGVIGNAPCALGGRYLSLAEREEISRGLCAGWSLRRIARGLGRAASTVSREVARHGGPVAYRAVVADSAARVRARRPKPVKLAVDARLRAWVQTRLEKRWSPGQIAAARKLAFADQPERWVSHETIYQAIYVQSRGALRRELAACLRTGRALRRPRGQARRHLPPRLPGPIPISARPAEAADRAVPGHWEGDLILGAGNSSAIGTLVERSTRFVLLLHLPHGHTAEHVRDAMIATITTLPAQLRRSLTWDRGNEMARHAEITLATDMAIYFCDPHSPWQRGTNENTNGLLRQYFPKGTDLTRHTADDLAAVAAELNERPRHTLGWLTPAQSLNRVLSGQSPVATTA